jgi:hypothetical protein
MEVAVPGSQGNGPRQIERQQIRLDSEHSLGSIPLGSYRARITGPGLAPAITSFELEQGDEPHLLDLRLTSGSCVEVPLLSEETGRPEISYALIHRPQGAPPAPHSEGRLECAAEGEGAWVAKLCGLAPGRYQLYLQPERFQPTAPSFELEAASIRLSPQALLPGVVATAWVHDRTGLPLDSVEIGISFRNEDRRGRAWAVTDAEGKAVLPPLEPNSQIQLWATKAGYVSSRAQGLAGQDLFLDLAEAGRITARVVAEACDEGGVSVIR